MAGWVRRFWARFWLAVLATPLLIGHAETISSAKAYNLNQAQAFLKRLSGRWTGQAITTPLGRRPYDMTFATASGGQVAAIAYPRVNTEHHWRFRIAEGRLRLVFLTTFGGNKAPQEFLPAAFVDETAEFRTERADRLTVKVRIKEKRLEIDVFRHGGIHVSIRLAKEA